MKILRIVIEDIEAGIGLGGIVVKNVQDVPSPSVGVYGIGSWDARGHLFIKGDDSSEINLPINLSVPWDSPDWQEIRSEIIALAQWIVSYKEDSVKGLFGGIIIKSLMLKNWEKKRKDGSVCRYPIGFDVCYERFSKMGERLSQYYDQAMFERIPDDSGMEAVHRGKLSEEIADEFTRRVKLLWQAIEEKVLLGEKAKLGL